VSDSRQQQPTRDTAQSFNQSTADEGRKAEGRLFTYIVLVSILVEGGRNDSRPLQQSLDAWNSRKMIIKR
jgi:hypothetical protein